MEEKERYTIESFEIEEPPVIFDNKIQQIILTLVDYNYDEITHLKDLLNHYFKRIKELELLLKADKKIETNSLNGFEKLRQENQQLKDQVKKAYQEGLLQKQFDKDMEIQELKDKIDQLKQSQKQLAIDELVKLRMKFLDMFLFSTFDVLSSFIDEQIKKLIGEK